jgi:hypothetical protein
MFERVVKLVKTDRVNSWRLHKTARSIFLIDFVSAFVLAMRYFFRPKVTLNYPFEKSLPGEQQYTTGTLAPLSRRTCAAALSERGGALHCLQVV